METSLDNVESPLEEIKFFARSANRIRALNALTAGSIERRDLEETTGISRPTLSRILDDFEERGLVNRDRRRYEATKLGSFTSKEFIGLLDRFEALQTLNGVIQWFPEEGFDFDLGCLANAEVVRPHKNDALAPTTRIVERLNAADRARILSYTVFPAGIEACWRATINGGHRLEAVFDSGALATVAADATMVIRSKEMFETGRARIFHYDGAVPYVLFIIDDEVVDLCLGSKDGAPRAVIETDNETILAWANATFDAYCREAIHLDRTAFAP
ncbi:helix-turn-helix transcriptional regulator [Haladaptatus halobius]|uniref:helix-turn-helix transcriptional regulator n=1 Tax=Haladaptatus halobius TaxID=2884875 RepID=UPI001D0BB158|nr:MarR family transcriptional regulator [Haladaptatus halobius]